MRAICAIPLIFLSGCSNLVGVSPNVDAQVIVAAVQSCEAPPVAVTSPFTFMEVGFAKVKAACEAFFVDATRAQQDALSANSALDAGLVGATAILNATHSAASAAKAITITTAGVVFGKALINQYVNTYTFNTHLYRIRQLVKDSMEDYIQTARATPAANYCMAYSYVSDLASLCSLAAMRANLDQQVALPSIISTTPVGRAGGEAAARRFSIERFRGGAPRTNYSVRPAL
jgi:hypothetical protein